MHRPLRRLVTATAMSLVVLTTLAVPAWAAPSFSGGANATSGAEAHGVTLEVPEDEQIGTTTTVTVTAPAGFTPLPSGCFALGWDCAVDGQRITWTRGSLGLGTTFQFQVDVSAAPGDHPFRVDQSDADEQRIAWTAGNGAPVLTVEPAEDDGQDDPGSQPGEDDGSGGVGAEPGDEDAGADPTGGGGDGEEPAGNDTSTDGTGGGQAAPSPATDETVSSNDPEADANEDDASSSGGSTAPTRTQGRSSGTTLEITPGEPTEGEEDPSIAAPDVAEQPVVAVPTDTTDDAPDGETAAAGTTGDAPAGDRPWQQVLGAALLGVGALVVGVRQWRSR